MFIGRGTPLDGSFESDPAHQRPSLSAFTTKINSILLNQISYDFIGPVPWFKVSLKDREPVITDCIDGKNRLRSIEPKKRIELWQSKNLSVAASQTNYGTR